VHCKLKAARVWQSGDNEAYSRSVQLSGNASIGELYLLVIKVYETSVSAVCILFSTCLPHFY
jgi:hypothetical protein